MAADGNDAARKAIHEGVPRTSIKWKKEGIRLVLRLRQRSSNGGLADVLI